MIYIFKNKITNETLISRDAIDVNVALAQFDPKDIHLNDKTITFPKLNLNDYY